MPKQNQNSHYSYQNYFSHFEAEHKIVDAEQRFKWQKKSDVVQNHLFDCRIYNMVVKDIFVDEIGKAFKVKNISWGEYVSIILNQIKT